MAPQFVFPVNLQALEQEYEDGRLCVQNSVRVASLLSSELEELVKGVSFDLSDKELFCVEEQDVFDRVYSLVRAFSGLTSSCKFTIVESLRSNFSVLLPSVDALACHDEDESMHLDRISSLLNAFKIYTFFLINILLAEESNINSNNDSRAVANTRKKKHVNTWNWEPQRGRVLNLIANSLEINLPLLFGSSTPDESYLSFVVKNTFSMFENGALLKDTGTKDALCRIIGTIATKYRYVEQCCASVLHLIHKYDFVVTHIADAVAWAEKKYADGSLASSLIREVGRTNPKDYIKDTAGAENVGRFLVELADKLPKLVATNVGILVPHFGGESYKMRNALIGVLGKLIMKAFKDIEGEMSSKCVRLRAKQAMLEILLERCRDASAYTRSRVLQVWAELCEEHSISIGLWNEVASVAAGRLEDKSAIVRKSALNLLIVMLQHNPFGPQLRIAPFEATLDQYKNKLAEQEQNISVRSLENNSASHSESCNTDGEIDNGNADIVAEELDSLPDSCTPHVENVVTHKESSLPDIGNLEQIKALVASLESGLRFSKCLTSIMPTLVQLMASSSSTDVENSILLLMRCRQFQIDGSEDSLRKMLPLVFSQDKSIYEAVENAFVTIYIRKSAAETAKNLANLSVESNIGDLAALESIVGALVSKGNISSSAISALWDFFCFNVSGTTAEESRGALSVLCMAAKSSPGILSSHVQDIIDIGFGRWAKLEPLFARTACIALERLSNEDRKKLLLTNGRKVIGVLESLITGSWLSQDSWYAAADKAISAIYILHPTPETIALGLLKKSLDCVFDFSGGDELQSDIENCSINNLATVEVAKLSRFLFVASHIAMNHMVYVESCARKIRKQRAKAHRTEADGQIANSMVPPKENGINAELGLAASEDALLDSLEERAQAEIVSGSSAKKCLIGSCASFLSKLCRNFSLMHKYPELQASAMLALCRFMIIDANFCDANLQLLFTVVENAPSEVVRSNCTIALGDLAVRFPNLLEPWTENMYARLQDTSTSVRKNAVLVLSHLILNDMMKVKGYINEMAIRLEDGDDRISNLAKLFFHELSKKGNNPIYNLLPDILGRLSGQNLDRECFYNIMQFLIGSIKKDKQMEALVEKLCHRFTGVTDVRQWEYIAYCLSQLTFTDKGIKKLIDLFKTYEHVLSEDCIMDHFKSILSKGKKFAKPELKACLEEFEEKLNKIHMEKKEQEVTARNAQVYQQKIDGLKSSAVAQDFKEESGEVDECEDGEVIDSTTKESPCSPKGTLCCKKEAEESSCTSSELVESDSEVTKFQSVKSKRGASNNRAMKADVKSQTVSTRRSLRSNRR